LGLLQEEATLVFQDSDHRVLLQLHLYDIDHCRMAFSCKPCKPCVALIIAVAVEWSGLVIFAVVVRVERLGDEREAFQLMPPGETGGEDLSTNLMFY